MGLIQHTSYFCKYSFIGTQPLHLFIYCLRPLLHYNDRLRQLQQTMWPQSLKYLAGSSQKKSDNSYLSYQKRKHFFTTAVKNYLHEENKLHGNSKTCISILFFISLVVILINCTDSDTFLPQSALITDSQLSSLASSDIVSNNKSPLTQFDLKM